MKQVIDQIKAMREERDLSQEGLARLTGLSVRTIARIESGAEKNPGIQTLMVIGRAFNMALRIEYVRS